MGPFFALVIFFLVTYTVIYGLMHLSCWLKKKYCQGESALCKFLTMFMCESCKEACESHLKIVLRAALFAAIITAVVALTLHFVR